MNPLPFWLQLFVVAVPSVGVLTMCFVFEGIVNLIRKGNDNE